MNIRFDFVMHWLWAIVWSLLALSGFSMVGAKYGWLLNFDYATADYIHRIAAAIFVILTFISNAYEVYRNIKKDTNPLAWFIFGRSGYQLFTFITTHILIITGAIIWICEEFNMVYAGFALIMHEYISYIALASVIWHIYKKCHALIWPKKTEIKR
ncbi:MAG: cytochrome b/b6 domain-containing protein [Clostridia bacterium]|nr:cytochrome b/b6 domain-containing protein [Clostridia bacterium]